MGKLIHKEVNPLWPQKSRTDIHFLQFWVIPRHPKGKAFFFLKKLSNQAKHRPPNIMNSRKRTPRQLQAGLKDTRRRRPGAADGIKVQPQPPSRGPPPPSLSPTTRSRRSGGAFGPRLPVRPLLTCRSAASPSRGRRPAAPPPGCRSPQRAAETVALATGAAELPRLVLRRLRGD